MEIGAFSIDAPEIRKFANVCAIGSDLTPYAIAMDVLTHVVRFRTSIIASRTQHSDVWPWQLAEVLWTLVRRVEDYVLVPRLAGGGGGGGDTEDCAIRLLRYVLITHRIDGGGWRRDPGRFGIMRDMWRSHVQHPERLDRTPASVAALNTTRLMIRSGFRLDTALCCMGHPGDKVLSITGGSDSPEGCATLTRVETRISTDDTDVANIASWSACDIIGQVVDGVDHECQTLERGARGLPELDHDLAALLGVVLEVWPGMPWARPGRQPLEGVLRTLRLVDCHKTRAFVERHYPIVLRPVGARTKCAGKRLCTVLDAPDPKRVHAVEPEPEFEPKLEAAPVKAVEPHALQ